MVIYAMARRGVNPVLNAVSTMSWSRSGVLILISERLVSRTVGMNRRAFLIGGALAAECVPECVRG